MMACSGLPSLASAILLYVLLDGFDLGIGMLFGICARRGVHGADAAVAIAPIWDGNETWLVVVGGDPLRRLPDRLCALLLAPSTCR